MPAHRTTAIRLAGALFALTLLTAAACGGDDSGDDGGQASAGDDGGSASDDGGGSTAGIPNPCEIVTLDELESAFGFAWSPGELTEQDQIGTRQCTWSDADPAPPAKVVSLSVGTDDSIEAAFHQSAEELFDATRQANADADEIVEDDLGLGDKSYRTQGAIYVLDGHTSYSVFSTGSSEEADAGLREMAAAALDG